MGIKVFPDAGNFRMKLALSLLTLKSVRISNIRSKSENPGVDEAELSLLRLIDEVSNGTVIKISDTGTVVTCTPGVLVGGNFELVCAGNRGLGYFLEFLLIVAPFCKNPIEATLTGLTNSSFDPSIEMIKVAWLPVYRAAIGPSAASNLKIELLKRGVSPKGGGVITFSSKPCITVSPISKLSPGKAYRIRGIAWTCRVSSGYGHKLMKGAKSVLNQLLSDVYITLDHRKGEAGGNSPGFGITIWAETKNGAVYSAETMSEPENPSADPVDAESLGRQAAYQLLDQVYEGGFVDSGAQSLSLLLMACESGRNASQLSVGSPTSYTISVLRLIRTMLGVTFDFNYKDHKDLIQHAVKSPGDPNSQTTEATPATSTSVDDSSSTQDSFPPLLVATCFGAGVQNIARPIR